MKADCLVSVRKSPSSETFNEGESNCVTRETWAGEKKGLFLKVSVVEQRPYKRLKRQEAKAGRSRQQQA